MDDVSDWTYGSSGAALGSPLSAEIWKGIASIFSAITWSSESWERTCWEPSLSLPHHIWATRLGRSHPSKYERPPHPLPPRPVGSSVYLSVVISSLKLLGFVASSGLYRAEQYFVHWPSTAFCSVRRLPALSSMTDARRFNVGGWKCVITTMRQIIAMQKVAQVILPYCFPLSIVEADCFVSGNIRRDKNSQTVLAVNKHLKTRDTLASSMSVPSLPSTSLPSTPWTLRLCTCRLSLQPSLILVPSGQYYIGGVNLNFSPCVAF